MTTACSCNIGLGNSRLTGCEPIASVTHGLMFVPYWDSTGAINKINLSTATLDSTFWTALFAQSDRSKRYRPFIQKRIEDVKLERSASVYDEFQSGNKYYVEAGDKSFMGVIPASGSGVIKFLDSARCEKMGVFVIDVNGNLIGNTSEAGYLRPFRILDNSIDARDIPATDKNIQRVEVKFHFDKGEQDADVGMIEAADMGYNLKDAVGLYDAYGVFSSQATTGFTVDIRTNFGSTLRPVRVTGLVSADFVLTRIDTGATITLTSVTENTVTLGVYAFVATLVSGKTYKLTFTKTGYDSNSLGGQVIIIP